MAYFDLDFVLNDMYYMVMRRQLYEYIWKFGFFRKNSEENQRKCEKER